MNTAEEKSRAAASQQPGKWRWTAGAIAVVVLILAAIWLPGVLRKSQADSPSADDAASDSGLVLKSVEPPIVQMPAEMVERLGVKTAQVEAYSAPRELKLDGTLFVDPSGMARVHSRFAGEIVEMGPSDPGNPTSRPLRFGDRIEKDQLVAVVWCKDLGEKKSEFVDSILHLRLDDETLARLRDLAQKGATADQTVRQAEYTRQSDWIARSRAENTLISWRLTDAELRDLEKQADQIAAGLNANTPQIRRDWSRVEIRSPISGVVVEMNTGVGDIIDTTLDVVKVANLNRLRVLCQVYEEDLPALEQLPPDQRKWTIQVGADANSKALKESSFDQIGRIIDPSQHTGQVLGWIDNPNDMLRIGQFVTATVLLPSPKNLVVVPTAAVVENGIGATVFVRHGTGDDWQFEERHVALGAHSQGTGNTGIVRNPTLDEQRHGIKPIEPHEVLMTDGVLQLSAALEDLRSEAAAKTASQN